MQSIASPRLLPRGAFSLPREPDRPLRLILQPAWPLPGQLRLTLQLPGLLAGTEAAAFDRSHALWPHLGSPCAPARGPFGEAAGTRRLEFTADRLALSGRATLDGRWLRLSGPNGGGQRLTLALASGRLRFTGLLQELDAGVRPETDLTPADRRLFGNGNGIRKSSLTLGYQTGAQSALSFTRSRFTAHGAHAERQRLAFEAGKPFSLTFETGHVDRGFDRASQLAGIERTLFSRERGFRWQELTTRLRLAGWAEPSGTRYRSRGEDRTRQRKRAELMLTPSARTRLLFRDEQHDERSQAGPAQRTTTRTLQWEQSLGSRTKLRAFHETRRQLTGVVSGKRKQQRWELQSGFGKDWKLQGKLARTDTKGAPRQKSFQSSLTGTLGKQWRLSATAVERSGGAAAAMHKHTLTLTGAEGSLRGLFRKTGLSLAFTSAEGIPLTLAPPGGGAPEGASHAEHSRWQSLSLLSRTNLGRSLLTLGLQSFGLPGGSAGGIAYWWRSTGRHRLQWELRRTWSALTSGFLVRRERLGLSYRWGRYRLGLATALNPEHPLGPAALGARENSLKLQTRIGSAEVGLTYGRIAEPGHGSASRLRRLTLETPLSHQGSLRLLYEANDTPRPAAALPNLRLALSARQKLAVDQYLDLAVEAHRWHGHALAGDLTWHLDLRLRF